MVLVLQHAETNPLLREPCCTLDSTNLGPLQACNAKPLRKAWGVNTFDTLFKTQSWKKLCALPRRHAGEASIIRCDLPVLQYCERQGSSLSTYPV